MNIDETPRIIHLEETSSTNQYMREWSSREKIPEGSVVRADFQITGRGQPGNSWESKPGENLLFSTILYPRHIQARDQFLISQIAALSVKATLDEYTTGVCIKWPNDVYWKDNKICGMLIENDLTGMHIYCSILGIGININQEVFSSPAPNPISLTCITGRKYNIKAVLERFLHHFYAYYIMLLQEKEQEIRGQYMKSLYRGDGYYPFRDDEGMFEGHIKEIEPTGHLILERKNGLLKRYAFKEVSYIL